MSICATVGLLIFRVSETLWRQACYRAVAVNTRQGEKDRVPVTGSRIHHPGHYRARSAIARLNQVTLSISPDSSHWNKVITRISSNTSSSGIPKAMARALSRK